MRRIWLAIRLFFAALFNAEVAEKAEWLLRQGKSPRVSPKKPGTSASPAEPKATPAAASTILEPAVPRSVVSKPAPPKPVRSEALTLLATLQREARFVDFIQEPLADYTDDQVGAAVRDVHRQCRQVLERLFALRPVVGDAEGAAIEVPSGFDAGKYRLTGNVAGQAPFRGELAHHGWEAAKCDVPSWSGGKEAALVVAPAEVEVK